ncbi:FtsK/SpoIIIE domain-containing protein [Paeniglutamicibacter terrestris]|uniref:FHA domain-containing protein n=1 Tax=Paeniglutamicibacter terrestris TaxID=2723403 RepID=A0ABX1G6R1_9MICC|nr:FHA domain-containing protein [Paeniglutamicibacter terrestris]
MKIKATLRRHDSSTVDVVLTCDATATVGDAARALARDQAPEHPTLLATAAGTASVQLDPQTPLAEAELGSGFTIEVVPTTDAFVSGGSAAAVLRVASGPDAGMAYALSAGTSTLGRSEQATVFLNDRLVSTRHARIEVGNRIELVDLNSANGILVDGGLVQRLAVIPGQLITLGATDVYFELLTGHNTRESPVYEKGGSINFNRSPRVEIRYPGKELNHPAIPQEASPRLFPWPMIFAPLIMGLTIFAFTQRTLSLIVVLVSPLMMLGNLIGQRTQNNNKLRLEIETFERQFEQLEDELFTGEQAERAHRRSEAPATATVYDQAEALGPLLWTRRPEHWNFLSLRLGSGRAASRNSVTELHDRAGLQDYVQRVEELTEKYRMIDDVPVIELLPSAGAIGIAGPRVQSADALRALAVQLFGLHAPNDLCTAAIIDPAWTDDMEWFKWLPHTTGPRSPLAQVALADTQTSGTVLLNALEELISLRSQEGSYRLGPLAVPATSMELGKAVGDHTDKSSRAKDLSLVLFVTNDAPVDRARLSQVIERGPEVGIYTIFVAPTLESLPASCRTFVDVSEGLEQARVGWVRAGEEVRQVAMEGVSREHAEHFARRLAPVVDSSSLIPDASDIPDSVSLLRILGTDLAESPAAVLERWRQNNSVIDRAAEAGSLPRLKRAGTLRAFIGQGTPDAMSLDLRTQGPHALVGGTTGSGKSEFLQAWVLAMAAEYSPDRVTFLFVDYKGGSAFADCVDLPHCVGLVTDLSPHLVRRALMSLRAELHHREKLFHRKKAKDLLELEKRQDPQTPPALVLVIDEFAALAGDVPEFVEGVVDIAQRGRSLGIHLILATQRPAGVIKDNLRANTNLRVALRMADAADSNDVVEDPIAAGFDPSLPGRGIAKTGPGRLIPFQSGYAGGWTTDEPEQAEVRVEDLRFGGTRVWEQPESQSPNLEENSGPNDQKLLVTSFIAAANDASIPAPRRPWLDDLSTTIDLRELNADSDSKIPLALADIPEHQAQETAFFEPDTDGHLLIYGTSGSGKSATLRSIAIAAGANPGAGAAAVYALEFGTSSLRSLSPMPHVGAVLGGDDVERIQRLFRTLATHLDDRSARYAAANAASLSEYRQVTGDLAEPRIFVLIDGFGQFRSDWELGHGRSEFYQVFMRIVGEGRPLGVHVITTADRFGAVPTAISANITQRVVLRMADEQAYSVLGVPKDVLTERSAPGRAVIKGHEAQIAVLGGTANVAEQTALTTAWAEELRAAGVPHAAGVEALPQSFEASELPDSANGQPVIGLSDMTLGPCGFESVGTFLVVGPPQSGKTNALRAMVTALARANPATQFFHLGGRRAELRSWRTWNGAVSGPEETRRFAKDMLEIVTDESMPGKIVFVVENISEFADSDAERPLKELIKAINLSDHFLVADGDVNQFSSSFGLLGELKSNRHGLVLKPDGYDGESIFKVPFPRVKRHEFPPGRGFMVQNGQRALVHVALVDQ